MQYTVALDSSNFIVKFTIKLHRGCLTKQPITKVRAQKWQIKNVMNTVQAFALEIQSIGSFANALGNHKASIVMVAQMMAAF